MEVFMHNLPLHLAEEDVKILLASFLHGQSFSYVQTNFAVHLHRPKRGARRRTGTFTVTDAEIGQKFLLLYGLSGLPFDSNGIRFEPSKHPARPEILQEISHLPWTNPIKEKERKKKDELLTASSTSISAIQFGWHCRDDVYSIEAEAIQPARLCFDPLRRELHAVVNFDILTDHIVAIRQSSIQTISKHFSTFDGKYVLLLELEMPPTFLRRDKFDSAPPSPGAPQSPKFSRMPTFPLLDNPRAVSFTGLVLRLVFSSKDESEEFLELSETAGLRYIRFDEATVARRELFSSPKLDLLEQYLRRFNWSVAFQLASLLQNMILDTAELLDLLPRIRGIVKVKGKKYTAKLLREFNSRANTLWHSDDSSESISSCFRSTEQDFAKQGDVDLPIPDDGSYYQSLHVTITPTTMLLEGPSPEQSNRVIRRYSSDHQENFLRVTFRDENHLQYRFDRDIDGPGFIKDRVGNFLKEGLQLAGRHFDFLAYSQSALKDHSVWFVKAFVDAQQGTLVNAKVIIKSLGTFNNLAYDPTLMFCPARYAARISQAFTATDAAVVPVEEILPLQDIKTPDGKYVFTDGVGTMSRDLARAIWEKLRAAKRKSPGKPSDFPHAYQVRYRGSKGMLSIDYTLNGAHTIGLRPSMTKFETGEGSGDHEIEIARAFVRPTTYYLNRPLIMLLEGLGIKHTVFHNFQEQAVRETDQATTTLSKASHLLERHGLGSSFRLPSTMLSLAKLGLDSIYEDAFYTKVLKIAVYHVLRDLKHRARIPIPNAWTLVGVADVHSYLEEGQVFACVKHQTEGVIPLEGLLLVSRSPTIHPGDIQLVEAIGMPPEGSCFAKEPLYNTIVFSIKGNRPLPSCLGGGDLDGDIYNVIPLKDHPYFSPSKLYEPAEYPPTERKLLDRPSTMEDVADFVMEYIISDVVGIIAINWLIIADQSTLGIEDKDCLKLAQLHSDAVDYPKSGRAVDPRDIPRLKHKAKPDWNAPETINPDSENYYQSQTAIGKLFRAIELNEIPTSSRPRRRRKRADPKRTEALASSFSSLQLNDHVFELVEPQARRFLDTAGPWEKTTTNDVERLFKRFSNELTSIAVNNSLSHKNVMLSEEEVIVGTITQKTSQPRTRTEYVTKVRNTTDTLVKGVRVELEGDESRTLEDYLKYAWLAWRLSFTEVQKQTFGAKSFGWLALGSIFDAMKLIEEHDAAELRSQGSRRG